MFHFRHLSIAALMCFAPWAQASTIAVIDSGVDITHPELSNKIWTNPLERLNAKDDDNNGYIDDINGWNFFANSNELIDLQYESLLNADIENYFVIQTKFLQGKATPEDIAWIKEKSADQTFLANLEKYATFAHGTHVAGITAKGNDNAHIMTIRLIPVANPAASLARDIERANAQDRTLTPFKKVLLKFGLKTLAGAQGKAFGQVGTYAGNTSADVANASLGIGVAQAKNVIAPLIKLAGGDETDDALQTEMASYFLEQVVASQAVITTNAPKTLFVFAAGNDGSDNDLYPTSPANIGASNSISVGASINYQAPAPFSNFGKTKVDVFAPGVGILSTTPGGNHMELSGTSQAAPFVAGVAAGVKDANPALSPADIKAIILGTVDKKDFLKDKAATSGITNRDRALAAAELSKTSNVSAAIKASLISVPDVTVARVHFNSDLIKPVALPSSIVRAL
ncbi:MAG: S8 family serine peptidase [Chitinophagaceae bacterium]|nr:S8 family serine peptidase [Oligoflexus sp.]